MKRVLGALGGLLLSTAAAFAGGSTINTGIPAQGAPLASAPMRANFAAAATDINNLMSMFASSTPPSQPVTFQLWANPGVNPATVQIYDGTQFVLTGLLDRIAHTYSPALSPGTLLGTPPIVVSITSGVATLSLSTDSNFAVSGGSLAFATVASGSMHANCTGGTAEPTACSWNSFANLNVGSSNGMLPYRTGGLWGNISTGTSGATIPLNSTANIFSALQTINLNAASLPVGDTGTLMQIGNADSTVSRLEVTSAAAASTITGRRADGTIASPTTLVNADLIATFNAHGYDGTSWSSSVSGALRIYAEGTWSNTSHPSEACLSTTPSASTTIADIFCIHQDGGGTLGATTSQGSGTLNLAGSLYNNGTAPTGTGAYVRATSPTLVTPALGVATGTSLALNGATIGTNALAVSGTVSVSSTTQPQVTVANASTDGASLRVQGTTHQIQIDEIASGGELKTITNGELIFGTNNTSRYHISSAGGFFADGVTGGDKGNGTINISGNYFIGGTQLASFGTAGTMLQGQGATSTPTFTATPVLGVAGTTVGQIGFQNATSGTETIQPATGALGSGIATLAAGTYNIVGDSLTQTLTNKSISGAEINSGNIPDAQMPNTAWGTFTSSPSCGTATFTPNSARSKTWGKVTHLEVDFSVATLGTCTTSLTFNSPVTAQSPGSLAGRDGNSLKGIVCSILSAGTSFTCTFADGSSFAAGSRPILSGVFENQ